MKEVFNKYGVIINDDFNKYEDELTDNLRSFLESNSEITIKDLMILQRHFSMAVDSVFSFMILEKQIRTNRADREAKK